MLFLIILFQDVIRKGSKSKYYNWFHIHEWPIRVNATNQNISEVDEYKPFTSYEVFCFSPSLPSPVSSIGLLPYEIDRCQRKSEFIACRVSEPSE